MLYREYVRKTMYSCTYIYIWVWVVCISIDRFFAFQRIRMITMEFIPYIYIHILRISHDECDSRNKRLGEKFHWRIFIYIYNNIYSLKSQIAKFVFSISLSLCMYVCKCVFPYFYNIYICCLGNLCAFHKIHEYIFFFCLFLHNLYIYSFQMWIFQRKIEK